MYFNYIRNESPRIFFVGLFLASLAASSPAVSADPKAVGWVAVNPWYFESDEMRAYALEFHEQLVKSGVKIGDDNYFQSIELAVKKKFPEYFKAIDKDVAARDDSTCREYGLKKGTKEYADCRMKLREAALRERETRRKMAEEAEIQRQADETLAASRLEEQRRAEVERQRYEEQQRREQQRYAEQLRMQQEAFQAQIQEQRKAREDAKNMRLFEKGLEMMRGY